MTNTQPEDREFMYGDPDKSAEPIAEGAWVEAKTWGTGVIVKGNYMAKTGRNSSRIMVNGKPVPVVTSSIVRP